jgi:signal transduction histidine kinase
MPPLKRPRFRTRLFLILSMFAVCPAVILTLLWAGTVSRVLPLVSGSAAWESAAATGEQAIAAARSGPLTRAQRIAVDAHEQELRSSLELAKRYSYLATRAMRIVILAAIIGLILLTLVASRVAGHLSRQLSRPLDELVGWTALIRAGAPLPDASDPRGAPEFGTLRQRMRTMARELAMGRQRALEAERARAFRETAQRVAHELKNPLTPIRFAVERLRRDVTPELEETVEVLAVESQRLEAMARSFALFGRLSDGPAADVDVGEMVRQTARTVVPEHVPVTVTVEEGLPMVRGHHDALARALANVLLNAVDACEGGGAVGVSVSRARSDERGEAVQIAVRDTGCGIPPEKLERIWEPYVTHKVGGTGLGLAIARQTITAHGGAVDAVSAVGQGTEIRFIVPVAGAGPTEEDTSWSTQY